MHTDANYNTTDIPNAIIGQQNKSMAETLKEIPFF